MGGGDSDLPRKEVPRDLKPETDVEMGLRVRGRLQQIFAKMRGDLIDMLERVSLQLAASAANSVNGVVLADVTHVGREIQVEVVGAAKEASAIHDLGREMLGDPDEFHSLVGSYYMAFVEHLEDIVPYLDAWLLKVAAHGDDLPTLQEDLHTIIELVKSLDV